VLGNTVLPNRTIESAVYPFLGPGRTIDDVQAARAALEAAYRESGHGTVFVDIPEQDVAAGIVRLQVTEGTLARVRVEGARYFSGREIRAKVPEAAPGKAPDLPALQAQVNALNTETRDRSVVPVLRAGSTPGTVDLTLKVKDELPFHGSLELNDQHTADTARLRLQAALSYDNLFDRLDSIGMQYQTAPENRRQIDVWVGNYALNLGRNRKLALYYIDSNSDVATLGTLSVLGKGKVYGARLILPLENTQAAAHTLTLGLDYKDFLESIALDPTSSLRTPISYVNLSVATADAWRWERFQLSDALTLNFGPRHFGNSDQEFADKRFRGRANYFYLRGSLGLRTRLPWNFALVTSLAGQYAREPVISNEQFSIGGAASVRGFLEAEELGDTGAQATLQLELPTWRLFSDRLQATAFLFGDAAHVETIDPLSSEVPGASLASWGAGFNIAAWEHFTASLAWADPVGKDLRRPLDGTSKPSTGTRVGDSRLLFLVRGAW